MTDSSVFPSILNGPYSGSYISITLTIQGATGMFHNDRFAWSGKRYLAYVCKLVSIIHARTAVSYFDLCAVTVPLGVAQCAIAYSKRGRLLV